MTTSRRDFIGFGLGAGALAAGLLPALGEADREIFYAREPQGEEALKMPIMKAFHPTRLEIDVGAKAPFSMLHISDSHLARMNVIDLAKADEKELAWYESRRRCFADAETGLAAALVYAKVKRLPILHTGDLLDYVSDAGIREMKRNLEGRDVLYAIGNHELGGTPRPSPHGKALAPARALLEPWFPNKFMLTSKTINGVNFVAFDNIGMCADLVDRQFAAIKAEFAKGLPVVMAYHIPFYTEELADGLMKVDGYKPSSRDAINEAWLAACPGKPTLEINRRLRAWLPQQKNLKALLCGHMHHECQVDFTDKVKQYVCGGSFKGNAYEILFK